MSQAQKQGRKILRIGIIQNKKIIEERLLRKREPVTVGESAKNTFALPATGLPSRFPLFELKGDKYYLTFAEWMEGRVSLGTKALTLQDLRTQGVAKKVGQVEYRNPKDPQKKRKVFVYQVPLTDKSRGKLTFGEVLLLFQFVDPPKLPAKSSVKFVQGSWFQGFDWVYASILLFSFILHASVIYWCQITGPLPHTTLDQIPERFAKLIVPKMEKKVVLKKKDTKGEGKGKKGANRRRATRRRRTSSRRRVAPGPRRRLTAAERAARRAAYRARVSRRLARVGIIALIGAKGSGAGGAVQDVIAGNRIGGKLDEALKGVSGVAVGGADVPRGTRRGGGGRGSLSVKASLQGPVGGGGGGGNIGGRRKRVRIRSSMKIQEIEPEGGTLNQAALARLLRRKRSAFQYCYEKELKRNPGLRGKISIRILIAMTGRVSETEIQENRLGSAVARCIISKLRRIRFPKPKGEPVSIVLPLIFSPSS